MANKWPSMIPPDLRSKLDPVLGRLTRPLAADVWTELRDWLCKHEVAPPEELPEDKDRDGPPKFW